MICDVKSGILASMAKSENNLNAFERVKLARHPDRPYALDLFKRMFSNFLEIHGDRRFGDDAALVCGFAKIGDFDVGVIGQQKGRDTNERRYRNFGMPKPEGYRKAVRFMKIAEKFARPLVTFVDTPGAYPGIDAEERGQAEAIAYNLREMAKLRVPTLVVILGEGGSGGALAIGIGDRVLMMENSIYSVISPEGCAAILWKDAGMSERAAKNLKLTAADLSALGVIDGVIKESATWKKPAEDDDQEDEVTKNLRKELVRHLKELSAIPEKERLEYRYKKFRNMGKWVTSK